MRALFGAASCLEQRYTARPAHASTAQPSVARTRGRPHCMFLHRSGQRGSCVSATRCTFDAEGPRRHRPHWQQAEARQGQGEQPDLVAGGEGKGWCSGGGRCRCSPEAAEQAQPVAIDEDNSCNGQKRVRFERNPPRATGLRRVLPASEPWSWGGRWNYPTDHPKECGLDTQTAPLERQICRPRRARRR